ncbi:nucleotidyltransferase domain-containing protein, partial [Patescibacteria group bacterium]|nr:nucleotidyltransferase domain-containing protein [Patescibacteria group bacterium]
MERDLILEKIAKIIQESASGDYKILLFGSWAKGNALDTSDIDIGILGEKKVPFGIMVKIFNKADNIPTLRSIDIVDLTTKDKEYKKNVLKYA